MFWNLLSSVIKSKKRWNSNFQVKVKQSHHRPGQALKVPGDWGSQNLRQWAYEGGKFVSPTHRPPLPPHPQEIFPVLISVRGWVDTRTTVWPEWLCQWEIPLTPLGIEPATFRFVTPPRTPVIVSGSPKCSVKTFRSATLSILNHTCSNMELKPSFWGDK